ncbi:hypothetical protein V8E53_012188 [Lactarius tabidus]
MSSLVDGVPQANALARLVDLQNENAEAVWFENRARVVLRDARRCKVRVCPSQGPACYWRDLAVLLTLQIHRLWKHLGEFKRDVADWSNLRRLVHQ